LNDRTESTTPATPAKPQLLPLGCRVYDAAQAAGIVVLESASPSVIVRPLRLELQSDPPELAAQLHALEVPQPLEYIGLLDYGDSPRVAEDDIPKRIEQLQARGRSIADLQADQPFELKPGRELKLRFQSPPRAFGMRITQATLIVELVPPAELQR